MGNKMKNIRFNIKESNLFNSFTQVCNKQTSKSYLRVIMVEEKLCRCGQTQTKI